MNMSPLRFPLRLQRRWLVSLCVFGWFVALAPAAEPDRRSFSIPASTADKSLRLFAAQSGAEVVYPAELVRGVRTPAVQGELTPAEAVVRLLAGTGLESTRDERTGAFSISRIHDPNG